MAEDCLGEAIDWLTPQQAVDFALSKFGSQVAAKQEIADRLLDGKIRARAEMAWVSKIRDVTDAWHSGFEDDAEPLRNVDLNDRTWRDSVDWARDIAQWRWPEGRFYITLCARPIKREFLENVTFAAPDLADLVDTTLIKSTASSGRTPDSVRWTNFWLEVVALAKAGRLNAGEFSSQAELSRELIYAMGKGAFDPDTIKGRVRQIYMRFVADQG